MSAYIVDNETIHKLVAYFKKYPDLLGWDKAKSLQRKQECYDLEIVTPAEDKRNVWSEFGSELRSMNVEAVASRYPRSALDELPGKMDEHSYIHRACLRPSDVEAYKLLLSYLYQCSEGKIPESELFQTMEKSHYNLARKIIRALPSYESAIWA